MTQLMRSIGRSATVWALKVGIRCCDSLLRMLWPALHNTLLLVASLLPAEVMDCVRASRTFRQAAAAMRETFRGPELSITREFEAAEVILLYSQPARRLSSVPNTENMQARAKAAEDDLHKATSYQATTVALSRQLTRAEEDRRAAQAHVDVVAAQHHRTTQKLAQSQLMFVTLAGRYTQLHREKVATEARGAKEVEEFHKKLADLNVQLSDAAAQRDSTLQRLGQSESVCSNWSERFEQLAQEKAAAEAQAAKDLEKLADLNVQLADRSFTIGRLTDTNHELLQKQEATRTRLAQAEST